MITLTQAFHILSLLPNEFDSHDFVEKYLTVFERDYVTMLIGNIDNSEIFRVTNASIGRFLSDNHGILHIEKAPRTNSQNVRGNITDNQNWRKYE